MVRTGAKPDWRAASLNQFFWQPSRTVPIHCTDNWKRRKVLEQSPVYRSLAGRGWIKYCIVSNITNCTPSCRQLCRWHYFISLFIFFLPHLFVGWSTEMHWFASLLKAWATMAVSARLSGNRTSEVDWQSGGSDLVGQRPGWLRVFHSTDCFQEIWLKMCQIVGISPCYWGGIEEGFVCSCQPFFCGHELLFIFFKLSCVQFLPSALLVTISTPITKRRTHNISFHLPTPKQMQDELLLNYSCILFWARFTSFIFNFLNLFLPFFFGGEGRVKRGWGRQQETFAMRRLRSVVPSVTPPVQLGVGAVALVEQPELAPCSVCTKGLVAIARFGLFCSSLDSCLCNPAGSMGCPC